MEMFKGDQGWLLEWSSEFCFFMIEHRWYQIAVDSLFGGLFMSIEFIFNHVQFMKLWASNIAKEGRNIKETSFLDYRLP